MRGKHGSNVNGGSNHADLTGLPRREVEDGERSGKDSRGLSGTK